MPDNGTQTTASSGETKSDEVKPEIIAVILIATLLSLVPVPAVFKYTRYSPLDEPMTTMQILGACTALFTLFVTHGSWSDITVIAKCVGWFLAVQVCLLGFVIVLN